MMEGGVPAEGRRPSGEGCGRAREQELLGGSVISRPGSAVTSGAQRLQESGGESGSDTQPGPERERRAAPGAPALPGIAPAALRSPPRPRSLGTSPCPRLRAGPGLACLCPGCASAASVRSVPGLRSRPSLGIRSRSALVPTPVAPVLGPCTLLVPLRICASSPLYSIFLIPSFVL